MPWPCPPLSRSLPRLSAAQSLMVQICHRHQCHEWRMSVPIARQTPLWALAVTFTGYAHSGQFGFHRVAFPQPNRLSPHSTHPIMPVDNRIREILISTVHRVASEHLWFDMVSSCLAIIRRLAMPFSDLIWYSRACG